MDRSRKRHRERENEEDGGEDEIDRDEIIGVIEMQARSFYFAQCPPNLYDISIPRLRKIAKRNRRASQSFYKLRSLKMGFLGSLFMVQLLLFFIFSVDIKSFWRFQQALMTGYNMCLEEIAQQYEPQGQHSPTKTLFTLLLVNTCVFVLHDLVSRSGSGQLLDVILSMISTPNSDEHEPSTGGPDILSAWKTAKGCSSGEGMQTTPAKKPGFFD
jgi:hypothetical protein